MGKINHQHNDGCKWIGKPSVTITSWDPEEEMEILGKCPSCGEPVIHVKDEKPEE